jgi:hypothetical protein
MQRAVRQTNRVVGSQIAARSYRSPLGFLLLFERSTPDCSTSGPSDGMQVQASSDASLEERVISTLPVRDAFIRPSCRSRPSCTCRSNTPMVLYVRRLDQSLTIGSPVRKSSRTDRCQRQAHRQEIEHCSSTRLYGHRPLLLGTTHRRRRCSRADKRQTRYEGYKTS